MARSHGLPWVVTPLRRLPPLPIGSILVNPPCEMRASVHTAVICSWFHASYVCLVPWGLAPRRWWLACDAVVAPPELRRDRERDATLQDRRTVTEIWTPRGRRAQQATAHRAARWPGRRRPGGAAIHGGGAGPRRHD